MSLLCTYILSFVFLLSKIGVEQEILVFGIHIHVVAVKNIASLVTITGNLRIHLPVSVSNPLQRETRTPTE